MVRPNYKRVGVLQPYRAPLAGLALLMIVWPALAQTVDDPRLTVETVIDVNLDHPTAMAFIGPNDFFICEKNTGMIKRITNGQHAGVVRNLPVNDSPERGLLGMALHPNFEANGFVYVYYSRAASDGAAWTENRVSRLRWNGSNLVGESVILSFPFDASQNNGANHNGGIIAFGPDNRLYGVTGDLNREGLEQNLAPPSQRAGVGGIFRVKADGNVPGSNPFPD